MIFVLPDRIVLAEYLHQAPPPNFMAQDIRDQAAAFSLADQLVDIGEKIFRQKDMCALLSHNQTPMNAVQATLQEAHPPVKHKPSPHPRPVKDNGFYLS